MATILVVDDRVVNRQFLATLLGYYGHELHEAADGAEALGIAHAEHPHLIIADIIMPTMDGVTFARRLRADPVIADIPIMFYTAMHGMKEARALADSCGVSVVLAKPSSPAQILDAVHSMLGLPAPGVRAVDEARATHFPQPVGNINDRIASYLADLDAASHFMATLVKGGSNQAAEREGLARLAATLRDTVDGLQSFGLRLTALIEIGLDLSARRDPAEVLEACCAAAQRICVAKYAAIGVLDESRDQLRHYCSRGIDATLIEKLGPVAAYAGVLGRVIASRRAHRADGLYGNPQTLGLPAGHPPLGSFLAVPLASPTTVHGWLYLGEKMGDRAFSDDDERVALALGAQAAAAFESAVLYDGAQRQTAKLQTEIALLRRNSG